MKPPSPVSLWSGNAHLVTFDVWVECADCERREVSTARFAFLNRYTIPEVMVDVPKSWSRTSGGTFICWGDHALT